MKLSYDQVDKSTICAQAWFGAVIESDGQGAICCEITGNLPGTNISSGSLNEFQHHHRMIKIRSEMEQGKRPEECWRCFEKEDNGIESLRQTLNKFYFGVNKTFDTELITPQNIELRLGNLCQLQCVMCHPHRSAKVGNLAKIVVDQHPEFGKWINVLPDPSQYKWVENEQLWEKIVSQCTPAKRIFINGGEPLLAKLHLKVLEHLIAIGVAKDVELVYSTNGLLLEEEHFEIWKNFKTVKVTISVDDIGERNRFIRFPTDWKMLESKLNLVKDYLGANPDSNIKFNSWCAINFLSFAYLSEYFDYFRNRYPFLMMGIRTIQSPSYFNPAILPKHEKEKIATEIYQTLGELNIWQFKNEIDFIVNSKSDHEMLNMGITYFKRYAEFHKLDVKETFAKLSHLF